MKRRTFFKSAAVLAFGSLAAKGIGALYRIALAGLLGGYGTGLYQMAYPLFVLLITFSSSGIPSAFSRMIARETALGRESGEWVRAALKLFSLIGLVASALMCLIAPAMSSLQGDGNLLRCYLALAPSVFFVALISVLRGYFQGKNDMVPTAFSEVAEQLVKAGAGLFFAVRFSAEPEKAVACALGAVTLSEAVALAMLLFRYRAEGKARFLSAGRRSGLSVLSAALPVMLSVAILPLSQTADSIIVVRLLSRHSARAVSLYGLLAGAVSSLVSLPVSLSCGISAASVPAVSSAVARGEGEEGKRRAYLALFTTFALSFPCALALFFFARPITGLLYSSLSPVDGEILVTLLRLSAVSAVTLSCVETLSACLAGMGRAKFAALSMLIAVCVKAALQFALVPDPALSVGGAAIAANVCYLVAFFLDLVYTVKKKTGRKRHDHDRKSGNGERRADGARPQSVEERGRSACAKRAAPLGGESG